MNNLRQSKSGYTLAELLVVIAIVGILATLGVSSFKSLTTSQRIKNTSFELFSSLSLARSEAIKRNIDVTLAITANPDSDAGWIITAANGETIRTQARVKGVALTTLPSGAAGITYKRTGRALTSPAFQLGASTDPADSLRCIRIELSGMPHVTKGGCT